MMTIKALTIRNLPPSLAEALEREKRRRGKSLNQTVIDLLGQGLGAEGVRSNGLGRLAGGWSEDDFRGFERATAQFEVVDEEHWS
jgi:plasmid stability protein